MSMNDKIRAFRSVGKLTESFDPMSDEADFPDLTKAASLFKKASFQADSLRDQGDDPAVQRQLWQAHKAKKDAQAQLLGATLVAFPHLDVADALHVAGKHIKRGNMPPFAHISALSDFHGARLPVGRVECHSVLVVITRAEGFLKCLKHHYPDVQVITKDMPTEGLILVQFPNGEHLVPQQSEEPQPQPQPQSASEEPEPQDDQQAPQPEEPQDQFSPQAAAAEAFNIKPFKQFGAIKESAEATSWAAVKALKKKADDTQERAVAAHLRRDPAKEDLYAQAAADYTEMQRREREHLNKFGGALRGRRS
jgi:hypothetical protein